jgi:hypothetical protein
MNQVTSPEPKQQEDNTVIPGGENVFPQYPKTHENPGKRHGQTQQNRSIQVRRSNPTQSQR